MRCQYPECSRKASTEWALVPLCESHHKLIREETELYYNGKNSLGYFEREEYHKISQNIPWRNKDAKF